MVKPELGTKRDCPSCGTKFYDLNKNPVACPKCSHEFVPDLAVKIKRAKTPEKQKEKPAARVRPVADEDDPDSVSLDELRDQELAEDDIDEDLLVIDADADDEVEDDTFLPDDDEDGDDVSDLLRGGHESDEEI